MAIAKDAYFLCAKNLILFVFLEIPREERLSESPLVLRTKEETQPPKFIETFTDTVSFPPSVFNLGV